VGYTPLQPTAPTEGLAPVPRERTAYDLLGLSPTASATQVRVRYRESVRRYRMSRSTEQLFEDDGFLGIVRSFLLLDSPRRRDYDRQLRAAKGRPVPMPDLLAPLSPSERVLLAAEVAFMRGQSQEAAGLARTVLDASQRDARAWALLGEILTAQHKHEEAVSVLNYAVQFDPNNQRYWQMLNEATALRDGLPVSRRQATEEPSAWQRPAYVWVALAAAILLSVAALVWLRPRVRIVWDVYGWAIPAAPLIVAGLSTFLLGAALAMAQFLDRFDDELIGYQVWYETAGGRDQTLVPAGLILLPMGVICLWLDVAFYAALAYVDERLSTSIALALGLAAALAVALTLLTPDYRWTVLILGGNAAFAGVMLGWFLGSQRRTVWRKVD
jgi:hypothetical protein